MLNLYCRQQLALKGELIDLRHLGGATIRAAEWEFVLTWTDDSLPQHLRVNGKIIREFSALDLKGVYEWPFSLPPTVRDLTQIDAQSITGEQIVRVINVAPGYQLPEEHLSVFIAWLKFYQELRRAYSVDGELSIWDLISDQVLSLRTEDQADILQQDIPEHVRQKLADLFDRVLKAPLRRLVDEKYLVDPGEAQHISASTIDYFIRHPETWHSRGYLRPRPVKLLDDRSEDDFDVYENRFVLHFLEDLGVRLRDLIQRNKTLADEMDVRLSETLFLRKLGLAIEDLELLTQQRARVRNELLSLRKLQATVHKVESAPVFSKVKSLKTATKANTALLMHPIYGKLYRLYQEIHQKEFEHERVKWLDEVERSDLQSAYRDYCLLLFTRALEECHFEATGADVQSGSETRQTFELREDKKARVTLGYFRACSDSSTRSMIHVEFGYSGLHKLEKTSHVWLYPDLTWWGDSSVDPFAKSKDLKDIYGRLAAFQRFLHSDNVAAPASSRSARKKIVEEPTAQLSPITLLLIHPTPPGEFDKNMPYPDLRLLLNQGDNFTDPADYGQYGGYRVGSLPIYPAVGDAEFRSLLRLKRLVRINLFSVGLENLCWKCFYPAEISQGRGGRKEYECRNSNCRLRWGEVICRHCGHSYFKMKAPQSVAHHLDVRFTDINSASEAIALSEAAEGQLAISSPCEDLDHIDDFWAICPHCGHCEKESKSHSCHRCQSRKDTNS